jgi:hypothetical protein
LQPVPVNSGDTFGFRAIGRAFAHRAASQNIYRDGETTWFEGLLLVGVHVRSSYRFLHRPSVTACMLECAMRSIDTNRNRMLALTPRLAATGTWTASASVG